MIRALMAWALHSDGPEVIDTVVANKPLEAIPPKGAVDVRAIRARIMSRTVKSRAYLAKQ